MVKWTAALLLVALSGIPIACHSEVSPGGEAAPQPAQRPMASIVSAPVPTQAPAPATASASVAVVSPESARYPAPARLVAIGDLHGDLAATLKIFHAVGAIDDKRQWIGGKLVVVQTGDQLDRGDGEQEILDLLDIWRAAAKAGGGALHILNGNHETMNVALQFNHVTQGGFADFSDVSSSALPATLVKQAPPHILGRVAAFHPGGFYALKMAARQTVVIVGDSVFLHGGLTERYARLGLARINSEVSTWMRGLGPAPQSVADPEGPVWLRQFSDDTVAAADCEALGNVLRVLGGSRMVVGHTVQRQGVTSAWDRRVWRIDVGLASHYGGPSEALEIRGDAVRILGR